MVSIYMHVTHIYGTNVHVYIKLYNVGYMYVIGYTEVHVCIPGTVELEPHYNNSLITMISRSQTILS